MGVISLSLQRLEFRGAWRAPDPARVEDDVLEAPENWIVMREERKAQLRAARAVWKPSAHAWHELELAQHFIGCTIRGRIHDPLSGYWEPPRLVPYTFEGHCEAVVLLPYDGVVQAFVVVTDLTAVPPPAGSRQVGRDYKGTSSAIHGCLFSLGDLMDIEMLAGAKDQVDDR